MKKLNPDVIRGGSIEDFMTPRQAARSAGVSVRRIWDGMRWGDLAFLDFGPRTRRVTPSELYRWMQSHQR